MDVLIDTNILIDAAVNRIPFCNASEEILNLCSSNKINGFVSSRSFCDIFYILRKDVSVADRKDFIRTIRGYLGTVIITDPIIEKALDNNDITDFEDAIQYACADSVHADYIVTRNVKDYGNSVIKAVTPEDLLELLNH
ncbi:MAG: PIN domain-containing protein [Clostridiales bacterium]|nr:PIN domain-containing protein [Clostridiales bacterium]